MYITDKIKKVLSSQFEIDLLDASLANLKDKTNRLRLNNFAYSIRELSRHFLYSLSPEKNIKRCSWYKTETEDDMPSRTQRIKYAIQGGISNEILETWDFDVENLEEIIKGVKKVIENLNRYTHINPEVFNLTEKEIDKKSDEVLSAFEKFVATIDEYRGQLKSFLDGHIEEHMIESVVSNFFENVDQLAPHHSLNHSEVYEYYIAEINEYEIVVSVSGLLHVTLEYGSKKERREGDGLDLEESFPFETKIRYAISEDFPSGNYEVDDYDVDTSSWYQ